MTHTTLDIAQACAALALCREKGCLDVIRVLDQSERMGTAWGAACTLQVAEPGADEWLSCRVGESGTSSLAHIYKFIRAELAFHGLVRVAMAAA